MISFDEWVSDDEFLTINSTDQMEHVVAANKALIGNNVLGVQKIEYVKVKFIDGGVWHTSVK